MNNELLIRLCSDGQFGGIQCEAIKKTTLFSSNIEHFKFKAFFFFAGIKFTPVDLHCEEGFIAAVACQPLLLFACVCVQAWMQIYSPSSQRSPGIRPSNT